MMAMLYSRNHGQALYATVFQLAQGSPSQLSPSQVRDYVQGCHCPDDGSPALNPVQGFHTGQEYVVIQFI